MSIYVIVLGIVCSLILNIIFQMKKGNASKEKTIISYLLVSNLVGVILELASSLVGNFVASLLLSSVIVRFYLLCTMVSLLCVGIYVYAICYKTDNEKKVKYFEKLKKLVFVVFYVASAVMIFVPIRFYNGAVMGPAFDYVYLASIICMSSWLLSIIKNAGSIDKRKIVPVGVFIFLTSILLVVQRFDQTVHVISSIQVIAMLSFVLVRETEVVESLADYEKYETYDILSLLDELVEQVKRLLDDKTIQLKISFDEDLPKYLYGDAETLRQVCLNLLTDSTEYTDQGFIEFKVDSIRKDDKCKLIMTVEDSGAGIKKDDLDNNSLVTRLRLAETKRLVESIGGKLIVQGGMGVGPKITVSIEEKISKTV